MDYLARMLLNQFLSNAFELIVMQASATVQNLLSRHRHRRCIIVYIDRLYFRDMFFRRQSRRFAKLPIEVFIFAFAAAIAQAVKRQ